MERVLERRPRRPAFLDSVQLRGDELPGKHRVFGDGHPERCAEVVEGFEFLIGELRGDMGGDGGGHSRTYPWRVLDFYSR